MSIVFVVAGIGLVALPGLAQRRLQRLDPADWCRSTARTARTGLVVLQFGLLATAAPTMLNRTGSHQTAEACAGIVGPAAPGGDITGWAAALVFGWVLVARWRARRHVRRTTDLTRVEPWLGTHDFHSGIDHVTIPTDRPLAYAVPGATPQIVVSEQLRSTLSADELATVIRHETSHLRHRHHRELTLACEIEAVFERLPLLLRSAGVLRLAVERVADEEAICSDADRGHIRSALVKTATSAHTVVPAFTSAETVIARIDALDAPPSVSSLRTRLEATALFTAPLAAGAAATLVWALASGHLLLGIIHICLD